MDQLDIDWTLEHYVDICNAKSATYCGLPIKKNPLDLWVFQEIVWQRKPEVIVELGAWQGASSLFLAHVMDRLGRGQVVACDINSQPFRATHPRIRTVFGDLANPGTISDIQNLVRNRECMVIHDADHRSEAVLRDIRNLAPLVTKGQYLIVEDGIIDVWGKGPGPLDAINQFMEGNEDFSIDMSRERYGITWNPGGYLERVR